MSRLKTYTRKTSASRELLEDDPDLESELFKPFHDTYKLASLCMTLCTIYPNPNNEKKRFAMLGLVYIFFGPAVYLLVVDMYFCILRGDMNNFTRHMTIAMPCVVVLCKMVLMNIKRHTAWELITIVNQDYERYNSMAVDYKAIVRNSIREANFFEHYWAVIVVACTMVFPVMAALLMVYSFLFDDIPTKYMVHDTNKPFAPPEDRFKSPFFEIVFTYMFTIALFYCANFAGYDGMFGIMVHHACLKMKIYCHILEKAFEEATDVDRLRQQIKLVVQQQCEVYKFVETIQETFNMWLGIIFVLTVVQICNCMYQVVEGSGIDLRYIILLSGCIVHVYLPCYNATRLKAMASETSDRFYMSSWERTRDVAVRKVLVLMIARGHRPLYITAFGLFVFDMELFVGILRSSYTMLTLLRP